MMVAAEKQVGRPPSNGKYEWSPALEKAGRAITYWKLRLHKARQGYVNPDRITRLEGGLKIKEKPKTKAEVRQCLQLAWRRLHAVQKQHLEKREEHLIKLAEHYAGCRMTTPCKELNQLLHLEGIKRIAAKHRWYLPGHKGMLKNLLVQNFLVHRMLPVYTSFALLATLGLCFSSKFQK